MLAQHADDVLDLGACDALVTEELVHRDAACHSGFAVAYLAGVLEDLAQQAGPVLDAAAVFVAAVVVTPGQEVVQAADGVSGVDVHDVVSPCSERRTASRCQYRISAMSALVIWRA